MAVTEAGISMEEKVQPLKAAVSMVVISSGMMVFMQPETKVWFAVWIMALQPLGELYTGLFSSTVMEARLVQLSKGFNPISVTEAGIAMEVKLKQ